MKLQRGMKMKTVDFIVRISVGDDCDVDTLLTDVEDALDHYTGWDEVSRVLPMPVEVLLPEDEVDA